MDKDNYILERLLSNGRMSISALARELNISPTAVKKRIKKLEQKKIIEGYTVIINPRKNLGKLHLFIGLDIENDKFVDVINALDNLKEIKNMYSTTGGHDLLIELYIDEKALKKVVGRIEAIEGVKRTCVQILTSKIR